MCGGGGGAAAAWLADASLCSIPDSPGGPGWTSDQTRCTYCVSRGGQGKCSGITLNKLVVSPSYIFTSAKSQLGSFLSFQAAIIQSAFIPINLLSFSFLISLDKKEWSECRNEDPARQWAAGPAERWRRRDRREDTEESWTRAAWVCLHLFGVFTNKHMQKLDSGWCSMGTVIYTTAGYRAGYMTPWGERDRETKEHHTHCHTHLHTTNTRESTDVNTQWTHSPLYTHTHTHTHTHTPER